MAEFRVGTLSPYQQMQSLLSGYWFSQCLYVVAHLNLVDHLQSKPQTAAELASTCNVHPQSLFRLLRAMADVGLFEQSTDDIFSLNEYSHTLASDYPQSLKWQAEFGGDPLHWRAWGHLLHSIKTGNCAFEHTHKQNFYSALAKHPVSHSVFQNLMASQNDLNTELIASLEIKPQSKIIDIGGGNGDLLSALLTQDSSIDGAVYDLPTHPVKSANTDANSAPDSASSPEKIITVTKIEGDFLDNVPAGADYYLLKFVLHNWDDSRAVRILRNCCSAMHDTAQLIIVEVALPEQAQPCFANRHDLNMLVLTGGAERSLAEYQELLNTSKLDLLSTQTTPSGLTILRGSRK